ncbi:MAG TPA: FHA domain-containing protein [Bacillota bacterium]|nr:FHA domain-containing protein [Bacillota bacterium]
MIFTGLGRVVLLSMLFLFIYRWTKAMRSNPLLIEEAGRGASIRLVMAEGPIVAAHVHKDGEQLAWGRNQEVELSLPIDIGRDACNAVQISDPYISAFHARISQEGRGFVLSDLASRNGTWCNDAVIRHPVHIKPGDRIRCGETTMLFKE